MWTVCLYYNFPRYLTNGMIFWKILLKIMCVFSLQLLSETFFIIRRIERDITDLHRSLKKHALFLSDFNGTRIFPTFFFEKFSNIKFHENPSTGIRVYFTRKNGRANMVQLIVAFPSFTNVPCKDQLQGTDTMQSSTLSHITPCTLHRTTCTGHDIQNTIILFVAVFTNAKHWTQFLVK
jgi:hypothetical protein